MSESEKASTELSESEQASTELSESEKASTELSESEKASTELSESEKASTELSESEKASTELSDVANLLYRPIITLVACHRINRYNDMRTEKGKGFRTLIFLLFFRLKEH